jgi:hypothetical protein
MPRGSACARAAILQHERARLRGAPENMKSFTESVRFRETPWWLGLLTALGCATAQSTPAEPQAAKVDCNPPWEAVDVRVPPGIPALPPPIPTRTPPPARWSIQILEALEQTRAVCRPAYQAEHVQYGVVLGCADCELGAAAAVSAPRALTKLPRKLTPIAAGAFTATGANETAVMLSGCEPAHHVQGTSQPRSGVVALLDKTDGGWRMVRYLPDLTNCRPITLHDGRVGLACLAWDENGRHRLDLVDFAASPPNTRLLDLTAMPPFAVCDAPELAELTSLRLEKVELQDLDGDGASDIRLGVRLELSSRETITALRARADFAPACACSKAFSRYDNRLKQGCQCSFITIEPNERRQVDLTFVSSTSRLTATAETSATLAELSRRGL